MKFKNIEYGYFGHGDKIMVILPGISLKNVVNQLPAVAVQMSRFEDEYTVYLMDHQGTYRADYTMNDLAGEYYEAMDELGIKDVFLYGASMGGIVSQIITVNHPGFVKKLAIASSVCEMNEVLADALKSWIGLTRENCIEELMEDFIQMLYGKNTVECYHDILMQGSVDATEEDRLHFLMLLEALDRFEVISGLEEIACPVLVMGSEGDRVTTPIGDREIARRTGCKVVMYPALYGHGVYDEAGDFPDLIWEFFEGHSEFYGWENADVPAMGRNTLQANESNGGENGVNEKIKGIRTPRDLYDRLRGIWSAETCAPRLRNLWSPENPTLGQCSITAFLAQDIFGGRVYGIPLPEGRYHCFNVVGECIFDLTSEQFGDEKLCYENRVEQFREDHFASEEKMERYGILREAILPRRP